MKKLSFKLGTLVIILFTANPGFANPPQAGRDHAASSSSVVVNPKFDEYVRRNPRVKFQYRNDAHGRLLGLADRHMTLKEMDNAITKILSGSR